MAEPTDILAGAHVTPAASEKVTAIPTAGAADGVEHKPYVSPDVTSMPEFTWQAVITGTLLGLVFGASSLYLVLKVGITVSASIPVAVLAITLFRGLSRTLGFRRTTILENNIIQTAGSAGESIAFGVGVTMPALMLIGYEMEWSRVLVVSVLGGLLGILMMIPLRRAFIVKLHGKAGEPGKLLYPEGTACAQVLTSAEQGATSGQTVFIGFGLAFVHKFVTEGLNLLTTTVRVPLNFFSKVAQVAGDMASELLGVGYIIGVRTSSIMMAGAVLGFLVILPTMALNAPHNMTYKQLYDEVLKPIGAGCVAAAGIISMCRTLPLIVRSFGAGMSSMRGPRDAAAVSPHKKRTEDDLSPRFVLTGNLVLLGLLAVFLGQEVGPIAAVIGAGLVLLFGFLFVTVSSRLTGEIGSSSNPISGMTVATLLLTCLIFLALGMTSPTDAVLALSIGGVVCIAASNGGTTSQDLKTGFLVGGTPRLQQWAIIIGALASAVIIGGTLLLFNSVGTVYGQRNLPPVNLKDRLAEMKETETRPGKGSEDPEVFHVWRPDPKGEELPSILEEPRAVTVQKLGFLVGPAAELFQEKKVKIKPGKYLVDAAGQVCYRIDPTITGDLKQRDEFEPAQIKEKLDKEELDRIPNRAALRIKKDGAGAGPAPIQFFHLWNNSKEDYEKAQKEADEARAAGKEPDPIEPYRSDVEEGEYLADDAGSIVYTVTGRKVSMKFEAPKTQVMGGIINGLLNHNLKWTLVLIGAFIAITLELCGISSLAFAVGVYIPMQYSTPIFIGGLIRWGVDSYTARKSGPGGGSGGASAAEEEAAAIAKSETSPGVLLASGLIAGGSLAGVLNAFMEFLPEPVKNAMDFTPWLKKTFGRSYEMLPSGAAWIALAVFAMLASVLVLVGMGKLFRPKEEPHPPPNGGPSPPD